jgi:hypothetical protein
MNITILSGSDCVRFPTMINQKAYADRHGYRYLFDITPRADRTSVYYHKLLAISDALPYTEWLFWIDDDAAFTQLEISFETLVPELKHDNLSAIFCASPVNPAGGWTLISSGNFFVRNDEAGRTLIDRALHTSLATIKPWWDEVELGMFTCGDQDALVYQIKTDRSTELRVAILEYERFNTRPYHFEHAAQYFLVHFTHRPETTKQDQMTKFCSNFNLTSHFLSEQELAPYAGYADAQKKLLSWIT